MTVFAIAIVWVALCVLIVAFLARANRVSSAASSGEPTWLASFTSGAEPVLERPADVRRTLAHS